MKMLAAALDYSPSELSMRTTLGGDSARPYPADDEHLLKIMQETGDHSFLLTLCSLLGYEPPAPKKERIGELVQQLEGDLRRVESGMQQLRLAFGDEKGKKR